MLPRLQAALLLLFTVPGLATASPKAQTDNVTLTVTPYLGGHVKYGEWLPLRVSISNTGDDLNAEVRAETAGSSGQALYAAPVPLPAGARKEVTLYVLPPTFAQAINVRLVQGEQILAQAEGVPVSPHPQNEYLIATLAPDPDAFATLHGLTLPGRAQTRPIPLVLDGLPERYEALRSLDGLILTGVDTSAMTPAQGEALHAWVERGGRLLIGGGAGAQRTLAGLPESLRAVQLGDAISLASLEALGEYAGAPVQVPGPFLATLPAGDVSGHTWTTIRQAGQALLVQKTLGEGWVGYLALDPAASPFDAWAGALPFWQKLFEPGAALPSNIPVDIPQRVLEAEQMNYALSNLPALDLPSVRWLALLLGVYILLVGPANYFLLRRLRRLAWAWVTIPVLTLTFAAGGFGMGSRLRGSDVIINQISILPLPSEGGRLSARSYVGLFSPSRQSYDIRVGGQALISPLSYDPGGRWGMPDPNLYNTLDVLQGDPALVRGLGINQWAMQSFQAETVIDANALALDIALTVQDNRVQGSLRNGLERPLREMILVVGNRFAELGDVDAGQQIEIAAPLQGGDTGTPFPWALFERFYSGPNAPPREMMLRQSILEAFFHTSWGPSQTLANPTLLAWTDLQLLEVEVVGVRPAREQTTLIAAPVPLSVVDGRVKLPLGLLSSQMVEIEGEAGDCGPNRIYIAQGRVTLEYQLPATLHSLKPTALTLQVLPLEGMPGQPSFISLYDWSSGDWTALDKVEANRPYSVPHPELFVNPVGGTIRLQAGREQENRQGGCYQFDLGLEGEIETGDRDSEGGNQ
jgi:hypothetical protein